MMDNRTLVVERCYVASLDEVWNLWTTKAGFESWWGPEGFRVEVSTMEARAGGSIAYAMIANAPEAIAAMREMWGTDRHDTRGTFAKLVHHEHLELRHIIDFIPGVTPYESQIEASFRREGDQVRMTVTLHGMHDAAFTQMQRDGFSSQLQKLDRRFARDE